MAPHDYKSSLAYGMGGVSGFDYNETICVSPDMCVDDFRMMLVVHQTGMGGMPVDGIVGLCPMPVSGS